MAEPHKTLYAALLAAQKAMGPVKKDSTNPHFRSKYASLEAVIDTIEGPLHDNGLIFLQRLDIMGVEEKGPSFPVLRTEIIHVDTGEKVESFAPLVCKDPENPQALGGSVTYMRRYSLLALLGLAPEDDDGTAASAPKPQPRFVPDHTGTDQPAEPHIVSWTVFWKEARDLGVKDPHDYELVTGAAPTVNKNPQDALDLLKSALADIAKAEAAS